jgi:hypothetical protein
MVWTTRVLTRTIADSILVVTVRDWPTALAWWEPGQPPVTSVLMCTSSRVYLLTPNAGTAEALGDSLIRGIRLPSQDDLILQFPLHSGDLFGRDTTERSDFLYAWYVEGAAQVPSNYRRWQVLAADSMYALAYRTLPDHQLVGFVPYLGLVSYIYGHHGTVAEANAVLIAFAPGPDDH